MTNFTERARKGWETRRANIAAAHAVGTTLAEPVTVPMLPIAASLVNLANAVTPEFKQLSTDQTALPVLPEVPAVVKAVSGSCGWFAVAEPEFVLTAPKPMKIVAKAAKPCSCGCGTPTQSLFAPGHDARVKGILARIRDGKADKSTIPALVVERRLEIRFIARDNALLALFA